MADKRRDMSKDRNEDPITGEPGAHPVGVGVGTAAGGAAAGMAAGMAAGPVGAVVGAVAGGVAGAFAGKAVAEQIDPTAEDAYWRDNYKSRSYVDKGTDYSTYQPAYRYGWESHTRHADRSFDQAEPELRSGWDKARGSSSLTWDKARNAVRDAYDRTIQLREERLRATKTPVQTGQVNVRKEVVTEQKTLNVPVEREEVVIEHRAVGSRAASGDIKAEEIRIPVKEEKVKVTKEAVVTDEVSVGKRKVHETQQVGGAVQKERLKVEQEGDAKVRQQSDTSEKTKR
ncbi:MAG TPA: YsnF/AvaK domain-containing protein [Gemmataceae bacterium]|nr:YsnF/AvaK domain-containing protein [Gemmataceae bacterium]